MPQSVGRRGAVDLDDLMGILWFSVSRPIIPARMRATFGDFTFDGETRELLHGTLSVPVSPRAFDAPWGPSRGPAAGPLQGRPHGRPLAEDVRLGVQPRRASSTTSARRSATTRGQPTWIRTVYGFGYAFAGADGVTGERRAAPRPPPAALGRSRGWLSREGIDRSSAATRPPTSSWRTRSVSRQARPDRRPRSDTRDARGPREQERDVAGRGSASRRASRLRTETRSVSARSP